MRRFLRDAAVALVVGAVLVALAILFKPPPDDAPDAAPPPAEAGAEP